MHRSTLKSVVALAAVIVCLPASAQAQQLRRDSVWNGVVAGAAVGGALGLVAARSKHDICSARDCVLILGVVGGALGHLVDGVIGDSAPVVPGQWIDDSKVNGALIGAGAGSMVLLIDLGRGCGTGPGRTQCTVRGTLTKLWRAALFSAAVGTVVDAAIPRRAPAGAGSTQGKSRSLSLAFTVRF